MNRIDPELFSVCFSAWVAECWPDKQDLVSFDGKTSRRSLIERLVKKPCIWYRPSPPPAGLC
jgi:hypothetical protein